MQLGGGRKGDLHSFKEFCLHKVGVMVLEPTQLLAE